MALVGFVQGKLRRAAFERGLEGCAEFHWQENGKGVAGGRTAGSAQRRDERNVWLIGAGGGAKVVRRLKSSRQRAWCQAKAFRLA